MTNPTSENDQVRMMRAFLDLMDPEVSDIEVPSNELKELMGQEHLNQILEVRKIWQTPYDENNTITE